MPPRRRGWRAAIAAVVLLVVGAAALFAWLALDTGEPREIVVFRADPEPYRKEPEDPGVENVPNTGILVLEGTATTDPGEEFEVLMPPPEEPLVFSVPEAAGEPPADVSGAPAEDTAAVGEAAPEDAFAEAELPVEDGDEILVAAAPLASADEAAEPEALFDAEQVSALVDEALERSGPSLPPLPSAKPPAPESVGDSPAEQTLSFSDVAAALGVAETTTRAPAPAGGDDEDSRYRVRIAAYGSQALATANWDRLHREHNDLFGNMEALISEVVVGEQSFFRLYVGEFATRGGAETLCASLAERAVECVVSSY